MRYFLFLAMCFLGAATCVAAEPANYPSLEIKGFFQYDAGVTGFAEKDFGIRRMRTDFQGTLSSQLAYRIHTDYATGTVSLLDAYVAMALGSTHMVQIGKMKSPLGFELLQVPTNILFPEYGFSTYLVPNRDTGIQWISRTSDLDVNMGVFSGAPDSESIDGDSDKSRSLAGRVFYWPIRTDAKWVGLGLGANVESRFGDSTSSGLSSYSYRGLGKLFSYGTGVYADGTGYRLVPQVYAVDGPVGVFAEYALSSQEIANGTDKTKIAHKAWQLALQYVATGETATYGQLLPSKDFGVDQGVGALQFGVRVGELDIDDAVFTSYAAASQASKLMQVGTSVNWVWNSQVQWTLGLDQIYRQNKNGTDASDMMVVIRSQVRF
jgi:phosphate-selective porin